MLNGLPLPEQPGGIDPARRVAGRQAAGVRASAALPDDRADLLLQQRHQRRDLRRGRCAAARRLGRLKKCDPGGQFLRRLRAAGDAGPESRAGAQGVAVNNHLCEHFPYSRQQLFHLVRVGEIAHLRRRARRSMARGLGCDICKPAVASILASCWNEFVLEARHRRPCRTRTTTSSPTSRRTAPIRSCPRMAGGEITPRQADRHRRRSPRSIGLYTKITGGQRIDLFGARVHQLPLIWRELIAAGFESGHAYGKAMRTVEVLRRLDLVPLRRAGQRRPRDRAREPLQGPARAAQDQVRRVRLHARMRGSAGQGCRRHRDREGLESVRLRQRRHEAAPRRAAGIRPRQGDADPLHRPVPDVLHPHRRPPAAHRGLARQPRRRPGISEGRWSARIARHRRGTRGRYAARGRHLRVRMEEGHRRPGDPEALPPFHQQRSHRQQCRLRRGARPDPPGQRATSALAPRRPSGADRHEARRAMAAVCAIWTISARTAASALDLDGRQIAVFRVDDARLCDRTIAIRPAAPMCSSRGIVGDIGGEIVVASPIYKQHFSLVTGRCLEEPELSVATYLARVRRRTESGCGRRRGRRRRTGAKRRLVVVGNGMAGMRTVEELLEIAPQSYDIDGVRRRAARQLQPHSAVAAARRGEAGRGDHAASARVVPRTWRHAARRRPGGRTSIADGAASHLEAASKCPTIGC